MIEQKLIDLLSDSVITNSNFSVSVCIITFNHASFIIEAIESVIKQKTTFPFEIIIADDCSTDGTREILLNYRNRYAEKIRLILQTSNVGPRQNFFDLLAASKSTYIAYLEGDDYWISKEKLQSQVDFLENNVGYSGVAGRSNRINENGVVVYDQYNLDTADLCQSDFFKGGGFFITSTILFKRDDIEDYTRLLQKIYGGDRLLSILLTEKGRKIKKLDVAFCAYRVHSGGVYSKNSEFIKYKKIYEDFKLYKKSEYYPKYKKEIDSKLSSSLYVFGKNYIQNKQWGNYFSSLSEILKLTRLTSRIFHFKMFVSHFILPFFLRRIK